MAPRRHGATPSLCATRDADPLRHRGKCVCDPTGDCTPVCGGCSRSVLLERPGGKPSHQIGVAWRVLLSCHSLQQSHASGQSTSGRLIFSLHQPLPLPRYIHLPDHLPLPDHLLTPMTPPPQAPLDFGPGLSCSVANADSDSLHDPPPAAGAARAPHDSRTPRYPPALLTSPPPSPTPDTEGTTQQSGAEAEEELHNRVVWLEEELDKEELGAQEPQDLGPGAERGVVWAGARQGEVEVRLARCPRGKRNARADLQVFR